MIASGLGEPTAESFPRYRSVAESALLVEFGETIAHEIHDRVARLDAALASSPFDGFLEAVPAYAAILVVFDPTVADHADARAAVETLVAVAAPVARRPTVREVEVCYDGDLAPDLDGVAEAAGMSRDAAIAAHLAGRYRVFMYGFAPGYAYLAGVPDVLHRPRKDAAVRGVPQGSVLIAGPQCLVTTLTMPSGWWVIGRSPAHILSDDADRPFLFDVGDEVVFPAHRPGSVRRTRRLAAMSDAVLAVRQVGPITTIQDWGRPGWMRFGVPASGPMDRRSFAVAQAALGPAGDGRGIEVSVGGLTLQCVAGAVTVAVAGGGFRVEVEGEVSPSWTVRRLERGSTLVIRPGPWGSWTYLAIAGRLDAPTWLGSAATHLLSGRGGGRLTVGQHLLVRDATALSGPSRRIPFPVTGRPRAAVRVVIGPQERFFPAIALDTLLSARFALTTAYDRMGVRLTGPSLAVQGPMTMPSEPIRRGSIQVSGDGVATVLLADHQTTGGYPKIATVLADDLDGLVQLRGRGPGHLSCRDAGAGRRLRPHAIPGPCRIPARACPACRRDRLRRFVLRAGRCRCVTVPGVGRRRGPQGIRRLARSCRNRSKND